MRSAVRGVRRAGLALAAMATMVAALPGGGADSAIAGDPSAVVTEQWAGYMTPAGSYDRVTARWTEPRVTCPRGESGLGVWVGLDHTNAVQQAGTAVDCEDGEARHYAWFELWPRLPERFEGARVEPGDRMEATVSTEDGRNYRLQVINHTRGWNRVTHEHCPHASRASAEVFVEGYGRPERALADFGRVTFTDVAVDGRNLRAVKAFKYEMRGERGRQATTGDLNRQGTGFTVTWRSKEP